jgi:hypothetical protein
MKLTSNQACQGFVTEDEMSSKCLTFRVESVACESSLSDLLLYENAETPGVPLDDVQEVSSYVAALNHGLKRLRGGFPLSLRLIREIHEVLRSKGRGSHAQPGEFRRSQNWIRGTRPGSAAYVPPGGFGKRQIKRREPPATSTSSSGRIKRRSNTSAAARRPRCSFIHMLKSIHCSPSRAMLAR